MTGVLKSLGSFGMDKILGQGVQTGGILIPQTKINQLIVQKNLLTAKQNVISLKLLKELRHDLRMCEIWLRSH